MARMRSALLSMGVRCWPALALAMSAQGAAAYDWPQFNGDAAHSGNNTAETAITRNNVGALSLLFQADLPDVADGAPVVLQGAATAGGPRDIVFVTTRDRKSVV